MIRSNVEKNYFDWMYSLVCDEDYNELTYYKLLNHLYDMEFIYVLEDDANRAIDGVDFRYKFGYKFGYSIGTIKSYIDTRPCSVLEMMVALAYRIEESIMDDPEYGDRTGQWFWNMVVSLGLGSMCDARYDERFVSSVVHNFLNRNYKPNGEGGLFTILDVRTDLRNIDIWHQAMWHLYDY